MVARNEAFLSIEGALADRLNNVYRRETAKQIEKIAKAAKDGDFVRAFELIDEIDVTDAINRQAGIMRVTGMTSILFGAREFARADNTSFANQPPPEILDKAVAGTAASAVTVVNENLRQRLKDLVGREITARRATGQATTSFVQNFVSFGKNYTKNQASLISSLHTSRLSSWGYTVEAESRGFTSFQVSEVLDGRTCPVCETMDGRVFEVEPAKRRLELQLSVDDPSQLKGMAPWPKQDPDSVATLREMSKDDIIQAGWDTPPYHPLCRGVLVRV